MSGPRYELTPAQRERWERIHDLAMHGHLAHLEGDRAGEDEALDEIVGLLREVVEGGDA